MAQRASKSRSAASATRIQELNDRDIGRTPREPLAFDPNLLLTRLETGKTIHHFRDKQPIFYQGDTADAVFYIQKGKVKLTVVSKRGKEAVVAILQHGDFFGEGCLSAQPLRIASATSMQPLTILRLEKTVMFVTISLIIFVAALNLISSLSMLITEKRPQVGVLRTLGATEKTILSLFLQVGLFTGITGTLLGDIVGIGIAWSANRYHLIPLPRDMYWLSYLPLHINASDVIAVNAVAVVLSVLATWVPARIASRLDPIAAIRE